MNGLAVCAILAGILYFLLFNWTFIYFYLAAVSTYFLLSWYLIPSSAKRFNGTRRKIQISTWSDPVRPNIIGYFKVRATKTLEFIEKASIKTGQKISLANLLAKSIGAAIAEHKDINQKIVLGNFSPLKTINISFVTYIDGNEDVYITNIPEVDKKSLSTIANEMQAKKDSLLSGEDYRKFKKDSSVFAKVPTCVIGVLLEIIGFLTSALSIGIPSLGLKANPFGSFIVADFSMLKTEVVYPPLIPMSRSPVSFVITAVHDEVLVRDSQIVVEKVFNVCCTVDHRYADGVRLAGAQNMIKKYMENPEEFIKIE